MAPKEAVTTTEHSELRQTFEKIVEKYRNTRGQCYPHEALNYVRETNVDDVDLSATNTTQPETLPRAPALGPVGIVR